MEDKIVKQQCMDDKAKAEGRIITELKLVGPDGERVVPQNTPYVLKAGEKLVGTVMSYRGEIHDMAEDNKIGAGDLVAAITTSTGFKKWWDKQHGGECLPCKERVATLNYIKFKGPKWLTKWIKGNK